MEDESTESRNKARLAIIELANMISVPMSLNAIVRLNVPDAIWQDGSNIPLSASQILARVLPSGAISDSNNLQRILRMLTSYGVFSEHLNADDDSDRKYSLTEVGKTLVTDSNGLSYGPYVLQHHQVFQFSQKMVQIKTVARLLNYVINFDLRSSSRKQQTFCKFLQLYICQTISNSIRKFCGN